MAPVSSLLRCVNTAPPPPPASVKDSLQYGTRFLVMRENLLEELLQGSKGSPLGPRSPEPRTAVAQPRGAAESVGFRQILKVI
ncbi:hypothetical protein CB1_000171010 [Camelus ferus]|nr:hypothetical protein CB1_000171010 [Camelus ferus]